MNYRVWAIATVTLSILASGAFADNAPSPSSPPAAALPVPSVPSATPRTTTIGGGVINPWRSPYRTT